MGRAARVPGSLRAKRGKLNIWGYNIRRLLKANVEALLSRGVALAITRGSHFLERPLHDFFSEGFRHLLIVRRVRSYQLKHRTCVTS
jgi:hypothetical protein